MAILKTNHCVVVSDLHSGCQLGLCPPKLKLDNGGTYRASKLQKKLWYWWNLFRTKYVPMWCTNRRTGKRAPYVLVLNGDTTDGIHHGSTTQISHNHNDQLLIAHANTANWWKDDYLQAVYVIRGTEAHVGPSGEMEEIFAREIGAQPDESGNYARYDLWKRVGRGLVHILHHIGTSASTYYEATAVQKELAEMYTEAAKAGQTPPDIAVRSHRHRFVSTSFATKRGTATGIVTPGWQLKTPFVWRTGMRIKMPEFGGICVCQGDEELYTRRQIWLVQRSETV